MPLIELEAGETERVIQSDQSRREYILKVLSGVVSIGHTERYASEGQKYQKGDEGELVNLQNPEQRNHIWLHAHKDAKVEIDTSNFLFRLFGTRRAERPVDEATADSRIQWLYEQNLGVGSFEQIAFGEENDTGSDRYIEAVSVFDYAADADHGSDDRLRCIISFNDVDTGIIERKFAFDGLNTPVIFDPAVEWPPGTTFDLLLQRPNQPSDDEAIDVDASAAYREER